MLQTLKDCKYMNNVLNKPRLYKKISPKETLLNMAIGETVVISTKAIKTPTIRVAASRLEKAKKAKFYITEQGMINETQITRLK